MKTPCFDSYDAGVGDKRHKGGEVFMQYTQQTTEVYKLVFVDTVAVKSMCQTMLHVVCQYTTQKETITQQIVNG